MPGRRFLVALMIARTTHVKQPSEGDSGFKKLLELAPTVAGVAMTYRRECATSDDLSAQTA